MTVIWAALLICQSDFVHCNKFFAAAHLKDRINDLFKDWAYTASASGIGARPEERVAGLGRSAVQILVNQFGERFVADSVIYTDTTGRQLRIILLL